MATIDFAVTNPATWRQKKGFLQELRIHKILKVLKVTYEGNSTELDRWILEDARKSKVDRHCDFWILFKGRQIYAESKFNNYRLTECHFWKDVLPRFIKSDAEHKGSWWLILSNKEKTNEDFRRLCRQHNILIWNDFELWFILQDRKDTHTRSVETKYHSNTTLSVSDTCVNSDSREKRSVVNQSRDVKWQCSKPSQTQSRSVEHQCSSSDSKCTTQSSHEVSKNSTKVYAKTVFDCELCGFTTNSEEVYLRHLSTHSPEELKVLKQLAQLQLTNPRCYEELMFELARLQYMRKQKRGEHHEVPHNG